MNRRDLVKALFGGTAAAGVPPVKTIEVLKPQPEDTIVVTFKERLQHEAIKRIGISLQKAFPGQKVVVIDSDASVKVLRQT